MSPSRIMVLWLGMLLPPAALFFSITYGALREYQAWQFVKQRVDAQAKEVKAAEGLQAATETTVNTAESELTWDDVSALQSYYGNVYAYVSRPRPEETTRMVKRLEPYFLATERLLERSPQTARKLRGWFFEMMLRDAIARKDPQAASRMIRLMSGNKFWYVWGGVIEESIEADMWEIEDLQEIELAVSSMSNHEATTGWSEDGDFIYRNLRSPSWSFTTNAVWAENYFEGSEHPEFNARAQEWVTPQFFDVAIFDEHPVGHARAIISLHSQQLQAKVTRARLLSEIERKRRELQQQ